MTERNIMSFTKPLIGITTVSIADFSWGKTAQKELLDVIFRNYVLSIEKAGGMPIGIPFMTDPETLNEIIGHLDGLLLTGGWDINPRCYNQDPAQDLGDTDYLLDEIQIQATRLAMKSGIPILGICRGLQLITVAAGGQLIQDIPSQVDHSIQHFQKTTMDTNTHRIFVEESSLLFSLLEKREVWVNSFHHQAVAEAPDNFKVSAKASDGTIEAMESTGDSFCFGIQWHPEATHKIDRLSQTIFEKFISAACGYKASGKNR